MEILRNLWNRLMNKGTARVVARSDDPAERRLAPRFTDGAEADIISDLRARVISLDEKRERRGRRLECPPQAAATILDVNATGARLHSRQLLPLQRRLWCRVNFLSQKMDLGMKIVWTRRTQDGYEYGARYAPIVPGTEYLMDNYTQLVLNRALVGK